MIRFGWAVNSLFFFLVVNSFRPYRAFQGLKVGDARNFFPPIFSDTGEEDVKTLVDRSSVDGVLENIMNALAPISPNKDTTVREDLSVDDLNRKFAQLFSDVKASGISVSDKDILVTEAKALIDASKSETVGAGKDSIPTVISKVPVYSASAGPMILVYGKGKVSQKLEEIVNVLGKAAQIKMIDAEYLAVIQESELKFMLRGVNSIIIAADNGVVEKKNFMGQTTVQELDCPLSFKGLKRLLNAAVDECSSRDTRIKVVALGKATKPSKSAMSFMAGDTTELDSEILLECKQRGLPYGIVKVGRIIEDSEPLPSGIRVRSIEDNSVPVTDQDASIAKALYRSPIIFSNSKIIEYSECTRVSVASEALLRSASHPHRNATVTVLSSTQEASAPSEKDWEDEFVKINGPELLRIPIRFAFERRVATVLQRVATALEAKGNGLVTPIEVERCSNGIRIIFKPLSSGYVSAKEEKQALEQQAAKESERKKSIRKSGYLSPEEEKKEEQRLKGVVAVENAPKSKKKEKPEGGLEVIVDKDPYLRVRVRRCNMGPETIIKEESEALIVNMIQTSMRGLDNDYKILMKLPLDAFVNKSK